MLFILILYEGQFLVRFDLRLIPHTANYNLMHSAHGKHEISTVQTISKQVVLQLDLHYSFLC